VSGTGQVDLFLGDSAVKRRQEAMMKGPQTWTQIAPYMKGPQTWTQIAPYMLENCPQS